MFSTVPIPVFVVTISVFINILLLADGIAGIQTQSSFSDIRVVTQSIKSTTIIFAQILVKGAVVIPRIDMSKL